MSEWLAAPGSLVALAAGALGLWQVVRASVAKSGRLHRRLVRDVELADKLGDHPVATMFRQRAERTAEHLYGLTQPQSRRWFKLAPAVTVLISWCALWILAQVPLQILGVPPVVVLVVVVLGCWSPVLVRPWRRWMNVRVERAITEALWSEGQSPPSSNAP